MHAGASRINPAVASAVSHFNQGCSHLFHVMKKLGVTPAEELQVYQQRQDTKRCAQGQLQAQIIKRAHKNSKKAKKSTTGRHETGGPGIWPRNVLKDCDYCLLYTVNRK